MFKRKKIVLLLLLIIISSVGFLGFKFLVPKLYQQSQVKIANEDKQIVETPVSTPQPTPEVFSIATATGKVESLRETVMPSDRSGENVFFNITIQDTSRAANSDLDFKFTQLTGSEIIKGWEIIIPAGWGILAGEQIPEGEIVGNGSLTFVMDEEIRQVPVNVENIQNTQGHKTYWKMHFGPFESNFVTLDTFIDGHLNQGYKWIINRKFLFDIKPPITLDLKIFGKYTQNPQNPGEFIFEQVVNFVGGISKTFKKGITIF